jgi:hypothetical protein
MSDQKRSQVTLSITERDNEPIYYANIASIYATPEEVSIHFGLRVEGDENHGNGIAKIYLSLPHAKRLAGTLIAVINNYERNFGKIHDDPAKLLTDEGRKLLGLVEESESGESNG